MSKSALRRWMMRCVGSTSGRPELRYRNLTTSSFSRQRWGIPPFPTSAIPYIINWIHSYVVTQNGVTVVDIGQQKQQYVQGLQGLQSGIVVDGVMIQQTEEEVRPFL